MDKVKSKAGQAVLEYILLLSIIVSVYSMFLNGLMDSSAFAKLKSPLEKQFKYTYQYGHPEARGQTDGGPKFIPQQHDPQNFRIFINPPINE